MENQNSEEKSNTEVQNEAKTEIQNEVRHKNPKRVEAGKKGAAARKAKREAASKITDNDGQQTKVTKITSDDPTDDPPAHGDFNIVVYKNYIPICITVLGVGLGLYYIFGRPKNNTTQQVQQTSQLDETKRPNKTIDPFLMK